MSRNTISRLSEPIDYEGLTFEDKVEDAFIYFRDIFIKKENRPFYNNKFIFFDTSRITGNFELKYPERFIHITSLDDSDKYNVFPCTNDLSFENCYNKCSSESDIFSYHLIGRWECLYRLSRIHWIREVIDLANSYDSQITEWDVPECDNRRGTYYKRFIRYNCGIDDYVIILKDEGKSYRFITAFPVVSKKKKTEYEAQYCRFIKKSRESNEPQQTPST